jgi:sugar phosphate isomerase/epimerase
MSPHLIPTRRQFLKSGVALGAAAFSLNGFALNASPMNQPIGFQTFEIIAHLTQDWEGTWKTMAGYGYKLADLINFDFNPALAKYSAKDIKQSLADAGLTATNCHFSYKAWTDGFAQSVAYAHDLELKSVVCALGPRRKTADDYKWMGDQLNQIGARTQAEGLQLAYHNHEIEFVPVEGQIPWDILMANTDPKLVTYQIDVGNLTFGGGDAIQALSKYPGRYFSLHCKDFAPGKASVPVGQGILDWKKILAIAKKQKIKYYVTEVGAYGISSLAGVPLEQSKLDVLESFRQSFVYLNKLKS